jgi:two-component system, NarL family, nitrate/nitrite response regulator NarL
MHLALICPSPWMADGLQAALAPLCTRLDRHADAPAWRAAWRDGASRPAALVAALPDLRQTHDLLAAMPAGLPLVLMGDAPPGPAHRPLGLLPADVSAVALRAAVQAVVAGLDVRLADEAPGAWPEGAVAGTGGADEALTPRELEVFELLAKGLSNPDIGLALGISAHTAKFHVGQILAKTGAATRAEAVREGLRRGVIGL